MSKNMSKPLGYLLAFGVFAYAIMPFSHASAVAAAAYLTLDSFSGHPGISINASGGNYAGGETINFYLNSTAGSPVASTIAGGYGSFGPIAVAIPANAPQGNETIIGIGATSGASASNTYYVVPLAPSINVTSSANTPFSTILLDGSGFAPNEAVTLTLSSGSGHTTADSSGNFKNASLVIPNTATGEYVIHATGVSSGAAATAYFYVGGFYPYASPSAYYILPTQTLSFTGGGFAVNETVNVTSGKNTASLATFNTDNSGNFTAAGNVVIAPAMANSNTVFHLTGQSSHVSTDVPVTIGQFYPGIYPSAYYLTPGQTVTFSGNDFAANETINLYVNNLTAPQATFTSDAKGNYKNQGAYVVPFSFAGKNATFKLVGSLSNGEADITLAVGNFYPTLSPSAYYIIPGQILNVSGNGFAPGETVDVTLGANTTKATANLLGNFAGASLTVPFGKSASVNVVATGETSGASASTSITLGSFQPNVAPSSWYVLPGNSISFTGNGFAANENVAISVSNGTSNTIIDTVSTDALGNLASNTYTVALNAVKSLSYTFNGSLSNTTNTVTVGVGVLTPTLVADNYYVLPGSVVHFHGTGFAPGETVNFTAPGVSVSGTADSKGDTGLVAITVPYGSTSSLTVTATGAASNATTSATIGLASFYPLVSPNTYYTQPGSQVTFTGTGFVPNEEVTYTLNKASAGNATADAKGNLSIGPITIPFNVGTTAHYVFNGTISHGSFAVDIGMAPFYTFVALNNYYAVGGTAITVSGGGFAPNENVNVNFGGANAGTTAADAFGNFSLATHVPFAAAGLKSVTATGQNSAASATTTFTQAPVYVSVQLGSYAGKPGTAINFIGSGYLPNEPINITTDRTGSSVVYTLNADGSGNFNNSGYVIPDSFTEGNLVLTITGTHSQTPQSITFYVVHP